MSQQPNPLMNYYQSWADKTPYVTRNTTIGAVIFYLVSFIIRLDILLANIPMYSIYSYQIYRLVFSPLVGNSIMTLVLIIIMYPAIGSRMEWAMGSAAYMFLLGIFGLTINMAFDVICVGLYMLGNEFALNLICAGFWTILFALYTIECLQVSGPKTSLHATSLSKQNI